MRAERLVALDLLPARAQEAARPGQRAQRRQPLLAPLQRRERVRRRALRVELRKAALQHVLHLRQQALRASNKPMAVQGAGASRGSPEFAASELARDVKNGGGSMPLQPDEEGSRGTRGRAGGRPVFTDPPVSPDAHKVGVAFSYKYIGFLGVQGLGFMVSGLH